MAWLSGAGALLSGIGAIGGLLGKSGGPDVGQQQQFSMQQLQMQEQFQREMAQNSIQWRVNDAKAAGISPIVALGAPTYSPSLQVGGVDYSASRGSGADFSGLQRFGGALGDLGKQMTERERVDSMQTLAQQQFDRQSRLTDADIALKGAQAAYWSKMATAPMPGVGAGSGGLHGQVVDRGFGNAREELAKNEAAGPDSGVAGGAGPNSSWKKVDDYTVVRVPRDPVIASASPWNPEYLKWMWGTAGSRPPPMEALPAGTVRWIRDGLNQWKASPYWPSESVTKSRGQFLPQ